MIANFQIFLDGVPQALSGYRPTVVLSGNLGEQYLSSTTKLSPSVPQWFTFSGNNTPHGAGVTATQTVYNGLQTANRTRAAESQVTFPLREPRVPDGWRPNSDSVDSLVETQVRAVEEPRHNAPALGPQMLHQPRERTVPPIHSEDETLCQRGREGWTSPSRTPVPHSGPENVHD